MYGVMYDTCTHAYVKHVSHTGNRIYAHIYTYTYCLSAPSRDPMNVRPVGTTLESSSTLLALSGLTLFQIFTWLFALATLK